MYQFKLSSLYFQVLKAIRGNKILRFDDTIRVEEHQPKFPFGPFVDGDDTFSFLRPSNPCQDRSTIVKLKQLLEATISLPSLYCQPDAQTKTK